MLCMKPLSTDDRPRFSPAFESEDSECGELSFNILFLWQKNFGTVADMLDRRIIIKSSYGSHCVYSFPVGSGDVVPAINAIAKDARASGCPLVIRCITPENRTLLENAFPGRFVFTENRDAYEYVYTAEALSELTGKKLHAKRNYINRFIANNDWSFEPISASTLPECSDMAHIWAAENEGKSGIGFYMELAALSEAISNYSALNLCGGILRSSGKIIAFSIGSKINHNTFDINFEKAFASIDGAYAMINREFVRYILSQYPEVKYINREDDMGNEGLRKAKSSYYPHHMVVKYTAREVFHE